MNKKIVPFFIILCTFYSSSFSALFSLTNKTDLPLWIICEAPNTCIEQNDFFSVSGKNLFPNQTGAFLLNNTCLPKSIQIYTQNPTTNPGKPVTISLYGQINSIDRDHIFSLERTTQGKFVLKK